jgi:hypothetical protein
LFVLRRTRAERLVSAHAVQLRQRSHRPGFAIERLEEPLDGPANGALFAEAPMTLVVAARAI